MNILPDWRCVQYKFHDDDATSLSTTLPPSTFPTHSTSILPLAIFAQPPILSACKPLAPNSLPSAHALSLPMAHISGIPSHFLSVLNPLSLPSSLPSRPTSIKNSNTLFPCLYKGRVPQPSCVCLVCPAAHVCV